MMKNYGQICAIAASLELLGGRWTLLIIRELLTGAKRFKEIEESLYGIGANLLTERLLLLTEHEIVDRRQAENDARGVEYYLTTKGEKLRPILLELAHWGLNYAKFTKNTNSIAKPEWGLLAVEAMAMHGTPSDIDETYEFNIDGFIFSLSIENKQVRIRKNSRTETPSLTITSDANTFVSVGSQEITPLEALVSGKMTIEGTEGALLRATKLLGLNTGFPSN